MGKYFGTDGVRGLANVELSPLLALKLGATAAHVIVERKQNTKVIVGRDTRISGDILESALVSGICSQGVDAILAGVIPTPGIAYLTSASMAAAGVMISASHNHMRDNGIKFFGPDGYKLDDAVEASIESEMEGFESFTRPSGADVGNVRRRHEIVWEYAGHVKHTIDHSLAGLKIAVDSANGSASELAPVIFGDLGAKVTSIFAQPDGSNINSECGSLHPSKAQAETVRIGADLGLSFDGDADRVILCDEHGRLVDGDRVMAIYALHQAANGGLEGGMVVGTVMSNIGLEIVLREAGLKLVRAAVGDRYVVEDMRRLGAVIGGEKSGHIVFAKHSTTGDGMITALQVISIMLETGKKLSELADQMQEYPQLLVNVPVSTKDNWDSDQVILAAIADAEEKLKGRGRVLVRPSGTEKLIRVMAEGPDQDELDKLVGNIVEAVRKRIGEY